MSKRSSNYLLNDMLDAIRAIGEFTDGYTYEMFLEDRKTHDAVVRNIQVLGEAANRIPVDYRDQHPEIEWMKIIRSRHILVHDYFGIDYEIIWRIITFHLPPLHEAVQTILTKEPLDNADSQSE